MKQETNRKKIIHYCEELREKFCHFEESDLIQIATYFKEESIQLEHMKFKDEWKTYFYEFGVLFKLREIYIYLKKHYNIKTIQDFDYKKYIKCNDLENFYNCFNSFETFISQLRSIIFAHPITENKKTKKYYALDFIKCSNEKNGFASMFRDLLKQKVPIEKERILFRIQGFKKEIQSAENFDFSLSNLFFVELFEHYKNHLLENINSHCFKSKAKTEEKKNKERDKKIISILNSEEDSKQKIGFIISYLKKTYHIKNDDRIPFKISYLKFLNNSDDSLSVENVIKLYSKIKKEFDYEYNNIYLETSLFEKKCNSYKIIEDWFDEVKAESKINWEEIEYGMANYNGEMKNEKFIYFAKTFLFLGFPSEEHKEIYSCKTYGELYSLIIKKEIELQETYDMIP